MVTNFLQEMLVAELSEYKWEWNSSVTLICIALVLSTVNMLMISQQVLGGLETYGCCLCKGFTFNSLYWKSDFEETLG